jgi:hypothetical protein
MKPVFDYLSYKTYLKDRLGRGERSRFASHLRCQASFLSQVLNGAPDLSLEQGVLANEYFRHSKKESKHFIFLLLKNRAGSAQLEGYFSELVEESRREQEKISSRISEWHELDRPSQAIYYSSWVYGALHVLSSIPVERQREYLEQKLGLDPEQTQEAIRFLLEQKLLVQKGGRLQPSERRVHLPAESDFVLSHHRNYRLRALEELKIRKPRNLHYSMLLAVSKADAQRIRELFLELFKKADEIIVPSREEVAYQLCLDYFEV